MYLHAASFALLSFGTAIIPFAAQAEEHFITERVQQIVEEVFNSHPFEQTAATLNSTTSPTTVYALDRTQLIALTQPTIVRILASYEGTSTVPAFVFDVDTLSFKEAPAKEPIKQHNEFMLSGSGFIVSPDGHILTNSHVASESAIRYEIARTILLKVFNNLLSAGISAADSKKLDALYAKDKDAFEKQIKESTLAGVRVVIKKIDMPQVQLAVLRPDPDTIATTTSVLNLRLLNASENSSKELFKKTFESGIPAKIVYENTAYFDDERDVAIIKVDQQNLPFLPLKQIDSIKSGQNIYLFGYPGNADYNFLSSVPTFTDGVVSALKDSTQRTFKYIQTGAKSSSGSSGGPLFDAEGFAVGILTLKAGAELFSADDTFAFAIPISVARSAMEEAAVRAPLDWGYRYDLTTGIALLEEKHCKSALLSFESAAAANNVFGGTREYVQPYIDECNAIIASGQSIDSVWDGVQNWINNQSLLFWAIGVSGVVFVLLGGSSVFLLLRRLKREDKIIEELKAGIHQNPVTPISAVTPPPVPQIPPSSTNLSRTNQPPQS